MYKNETVRLNVVYEGKSKRNYKKRRKFENEAKYTAFALVKACNVP